jgi:predicted deacylase
LVQSNRRQEGVPSVYLSAGIHGDEPAPVEALVQWAEESLETNASWNLTIFPCLNPWGLERNIRFDCEGRDLNRCYNSRKVPQINRQLAMMKGERYDLAACLHEDYDARGFYLYEIVSQRPHWGELLRAPLSKVIPPDDRRSIDGHAAQSGVIRRRITPSMMQGHPEAFLLHFNHSRRTFTLETPSEESLSRRIRSQKAFLTSVCKKLKEGMAISKQNG